MTAGTIGYNVFKYFSRKPNTPVNPYQPTHSAKDNSDEPTIDYDNSNEIKPDDVLLPYTEEELQRYPLSVRRFLVMERAQKIRDIESQKLLLKGLIRLQNEAKVDEMEVQKDIAKQNKISRRLASREGEIVEKGQKKIKEHSSPVDRPDNIHHDPNDDVELEKMKLEVERTRKNPAEDSQLVKSSSASQSAGKRKMSEPETPSTEKSIEPPMKKSKSNSSAAIPVESQTEKPLCAGCNFHLLWSTNPKDGKSYCYRCHYMKLKCCTYKPPTGGKACFRKSEDNETWLCSKHLFTKHTSVMNSNAMDDSA